MEQGQMLSAYNAAVRCRIELYLCATFATLALTLLTEVNSVLAVIMGQTQPKASPVKVTKAVNNTPAPPAAAADPEPPLDPKDFMVQNVEGQTILREPGKIRGQGFILDGCKNCDIYLLDHLAQVTIDECVDCRIIMGPCESSVFIRDCKNCTFVLAVQQLRTRDCHNIDVLLFSTTRPIIESSTNVRFGCFSYSYFGLREQFDKAGLGLWDNRWSEVYDFTPSGGAANSANVGLGVTHLSLDVKPLPSDVAARVGYSEDLGMQTIPRTAGVTNRVMGVSSWLLLLSPEDKAIDRGVDIVQALASKQATLIQTRSAKLDGAQVEELWGKEHKGLGKALGGKMLVGLEIQTDSEAVVREVVQSIFPAKNTAETRYCVRGQDGVTLFFVKWRPEDR